MGELPTYDQLDELVDRDEPNELRLLREVERLRALIRSVDLGGTGFLHRPPGGREVVLAPQDVAVFVAADQSDPAERRGYEQAITDLRDRAEHLQATGSVVSALHFRQVADFLSARLTEGAKG